MRSELRTRAFLVSSKPENHTQLSSVTQKNEGPPISLKLGHHIGWIAGFKTDGFEAPIGQIA